MDLSRESIERGDFPRAADGLEAEAVAKHLRAVADAVDELTRSAAAAPSSGERVRAIVDAAERSAAELEAAARADAERIRAEARADLERVRRLAAEIGERAEVVGRELESPVPEAATPPAAPRPQPEPATADVSADEPPAGGGEAPRLIALNMMLNGSSREEVARYLDENFDLDDPGEILDEVWSRTDA